MIAARVKPKLNICIVAVICIAVFITGIFCLVGCGDSSSADGGATIDGIVVRDVSVEYDGKWHTVSVENTADGDELLFSTIAGGEYLSACPQYKFPGDYVIYCKVNRSGREIFSGSARVTIRPTILTGIGAEPVVAVFDGNEHGIELFGVDDGDLIEYSLDGESFSAVAPKFTAVGEYRIFYTVERVYGEYRASVSLVILPDLRGVYVDLRRGAVTLTDAAAVIDGEEFVMSYGIDGHGTIDGVEFSVVGETLEFGGATYEKVGDGEQIYALSVMGDKFYLHSAHALTAEIVIDGGAAVVVVDGNEIVTVDGVNYCENADTVDFAAQSFWKTLESGEDMIVLTERPTRTLPRREIFHIYDGAPVEFDIGYDSVVFRTASGFVEDRPSVCDVGEYEFEAIVLSNEYLPSILRISITVAPNIDGVYYSSAAAVKIVGAAVWFNGESLSAEYDKTWLIAGQAVLPTDDGITIGGESFSKRTGGYVVVVEIAADRYVVQTLANDVKVEWTSADTAIYIADALLATAAACDATVVVNNETVAVIHGDDGSFCIIGLGDFDSEIVIIRIGGQ